MTAYGFDYNDDPLYMPAGQLHIQRYGREAQEKLVKCLEPHNGYLSVPTKSKYWIIGSSEGKYGEYAQNRGTYFSINTHGFAYAKVGGPKEEPFRQFINEILTKMKMMNNDFGVDNWNEIHSKIFRAGDKETAYKIKEYQFSVAEWAMDPEIGIQGIREAEQGLIEMLKDKGYGEILKEEGMIYE